MYSLNAKLRDKNRTIEYGTWKCVMHHSVRYFVYKNGQVVHVKERV